MIKLIGLAVMVVGFVARLNPLLVVLAAAISTGLASGFSFHDTLAQLGTLFVQNRYIMMPVILLLPLIGMLEHHGLRQRAETLIRGIRAATAGRVILLYTLVRQVAISLGVRIGDHASMVRPLVVPMTEAAAARQLARPLGPELRADRSGVESKGVSPESAPGDPAQPLHQASDARALNPHLPAEISHAIRAHAAAGENVGNFFGEDVFVAVGAVLLMHGFFESAGVKVSLWAMALWGIPTAVVAFALMAWRLSRLDRRLNRWNERR